MTDLGRTVSRSGKEPRASLAAMPPFPTGTGLCTSTGPRMRMSWNFVRGTAWMSCSNVMMAGLWVRGLWRGGQARRRNLRVALET